MRIHPLLPLALAALLSACAAPARLPEVPVAAYSETIELNGRLSVNYSKDGAPESLSGKFNWVQAGERIDVSLASPLGQTIAKITVTPREATLVQSDQVTRSAPDIDTLTMDTLGWRLPVTGLRDWLQGYATAQDGSRFVASPANNEVVTKDGWRLRYVSWQDDATARVQPRRIDVSRPASLQSEALEIRIVIDPA
ncbi:MAG TPA: outer membrane lipoprotein LolB [Telluria sp.]